MKLIVALVVGLMLLAIPVMADDRSGHCADEVTGEPGLRMGSGECITPAEYDAIFSTEALAEVDSHVYPDQSVAEVYEVEEEPASERQLGDGLVRETFTFRGIVAE